MTQYQQMARYSDEFLSITKDEPNLFAIYGGLLLAAHIIGQVKLGLSTSDDEYAAAQQICEELASTLIKNIQNVRKADAQETATRYVLYKHAGKTSSLTH